MSWTAEGYGIAIEAVTPQLLCDLNPPKEDSNEAEYQNAQVPPLFHITTTANYFGYLISLLGIFFSMHAVLVLFLGWDRIFGRFSQF